MSDFLPSFLVDPVVRQARRISRLSTGADSQGILPESIRVWSPSRLWNTSPPPSIEEDESGTAYQQQTGDPRWVFAGHRSMMPSPPWDSAHPNSQDVGTGLEQAGVEFPSLGSNLSQSSSRSRRRTLQTHNSDTSINPQYELPERSRYHEDAGRGHSSSDPTPTHNSGTGSLDDYGREALEEFEAYTRSQEGSTLLPANDGMGKLRRNIIAIQNGNGTAEEKARMIHTLMMEKYNLRQYATRNLTREDSSVSQRHETSLMAASIQDNKTWLKALSENMAALRATTEPWENYGLSPEDSTPSFVPSRALRAQDTRESDGDEHEDPQYGCAHYVRNVKLRCHTCKKWYPCRFCHDSAEDHILPRSLTRSMLCMLCSTPQPASQWCLKCGEQAALYYCPICKLWNNDPHKSVYHCDDCGICRLGQGLGKDFFHCPICAVCIDINLESNHRCIERSTKCDCPICGEYLFTSTQSVVFMRCGHSIHNTCLTEWGRTSYKCPICSKSIVNMESQFRNLDRHIASQPMPLEWQDTRALVSCNDCSARTTVKYHFLGLKCGLCDSYNTTELQIIGGGLNSPISDTPSGGTDLANTQGASMVSSGRNIPRPVTASSEQGNSANSPWLSPQFRGARSVSPIIGNYFGTQRSEQPANQTQGSRDDEEDDYWSEEGPWTMARLRARLLQGYQSEPAVDEDEESDSDMSVDEDAELDDDDDDDDNDQFDIFGHR